MATNVRKERTRGVPRKSALLTASAVLLMAGPVVDWILSKVVEDYYTSISIFFCLLTVAGGVLLLTARERKAGCAVGGALALFGAAVTMHRMLLVAVVFWVVSVVGTSWNKAPGFLPEKVRMPVLNLICVVLAAVSGLQSLPEVQYTPAWLVPLLLATVGAVLLCGNVRAETFVPLPPEERAKKEPGPRYRSVPAAGFLGLLGALLLLADGIWIMVNIFRLMGSFDVPLSNLLWPALTAAAGVLLLLRGQGENRLLPAAILLLIGQLRTLLIMREAAVYADQTGAALQQTQQTALLFFSVLLLLLSAVGFTWNRPVGKTRPLPVLNAIAAALAAANGIWTVIDQVSTIVEAAKAGAELDAGLVQNLLLGLLLPLGLVLVNLAMEARQMPAKAWKVDGGKYSRGLRGFVGSFYTGVGGKLQLLAKISGALCLILGILGVAVMILGVLALLLQLVGLIPPYFEPLSLLLGGLVAVVSALLLAVGTWPLYAFGQIVSDLHAIRKEGVRVSGTAPETAETGPADPKASAAQENPDELPEL